MKSNYYKFKQECYSSSNVDISRNWIQKLIKVVNILQWNLKNRNSWFNFLDATSEKLSKSITLKSVNNFNKEIEISNEGN